MIDSTRTVGIELEFQGIGAEAVQLIRDRWPCKIGDDRTVRGPTFSVDGMPILPLRSHSPNGDEGYTRLPGARRTEYIGLELITGAMQPGEASEFAAYVSSMYGHVTQTAHTSIHIHVDVGRDPWTYVQNVLMWAYHLEMPLLRLAAAGGVHRGGRITGDEINDYAFTRPLSAPIAAYYPRVLAPVIDMPKLLAAETASEMMAHWGRLDVISTDYALRKSHYLPHRLSMVNLVSVMRQGTIEWRLFDAVYRRLPEFLKLVNSIHALAHKRPEFEPILLGSAPPPFLNEDWLSNLLGFDTTSLWTGRPASYSSSRPRSENWPPPVKNHLRMHHYNEWTYHMQPVVLQPVVAYVNNIGTYDTGDANYSLYLR